jgi:hypothetical protein
VHDLDSLTLVGDHLFAGAQPDSETAG